MSAKKQAVIPSFLNQGPVRIGEVVYQNLPTRNRSFQSSKATFCLHLIGMKESELQWLPEQA